MLTLKHSSLTVAPFPWQQSHACSEDRAMGLELELIELVHRHEVASSRGEPVEVLDEQIDEAMAALAATAAEAAFS